MMGVINEDNSFNIKKMINVVGIVDAIRYLGGYKKFKEQGGLDILTKENIVDLVKSIVTKLCEDADDIEVGGADFGPMPILYRETPTQQHLISYYRPEGVVIERYGTEDEDEEFGIDNGDNYLGSYVKRYESLSPSLLNEILYLLLTQI